MPRGDDGAVMLVVEGRAAEVDQPHVRPLHSQQVVALQGNNIQSTYDT